MVSANEERLDYRRESQQADSLLSFLIVSLSTGRNVPRVNWLAYKVVFLLQSNFYPWKGSLAKHQILATTLDITWMSAAHSDVADFTQLQYFVRNVIDVPTRGR